jgi:hypothetical protein
MPYEKILTEALLQAEMDTKSEINSSPNAALGCCTISTRGSSEQKKDITKEACYKQKADGFKVTWKEGSC